MTSITAKKPGHAAPATAATAVASACDSRPRAQTRLGCKLYRILQDVVFGVMVLTAAGYGTYHVMKPTAARVIEDIWIEPTSQSPGRSFTVHIKVFMNQICTTSVQWSLVRVNDNEIVSQSIQPGKPTVLGESIIVNDRLIPSNVPDGDYTYQSTVLDTCGADGNKVTYTTMAPKVYLKVVTAK